MKDRPILGCLLLACKQLNYTKNEARDLLGEVSILLETMAVEEADEGYSWYASLDKVEEKKIEKVLLSNSDVLKVRNKIIPKNPKRTTTISKNYESKLEKDNKKLLELIRSYM